MLPDHWCSHSVHEADHSLLPNGLSDALLKWRRTSAFPHLGHVSVLLTEPAMPARYNYLHIECRWRTRLKLGGGCVDAHSVRFCLSERTSHTGCPGAFTKPEREVTTMQRQAVTERFTTFPGRCFRYVDSDNGHTRHCPEQTVHARHYTDSRGNRWTVDACAEHVAELDR